MLWKKSGAELLRRAGGGGWKLAFCALIMGLSAELSAYQGDSEPAKGGEQEVIVRREAVQLFSAEAYRVPMSLAPARVVELISPVDGVVRVVSVKAGDKLRDKAEAFRLDDSRQQLVIKRAASLLKGAQAEKKLAQSKGDAETQALAEAKLEAAQAELELANYDASQLVIRTPFAGEVERVHVTDGEFVLAGQKLARLFDPSQLRVEAPVDRSVTNVGGTTEISVEGTPIQGKVDAVVALDEKFAAVRDLIASPAQGFLSIDNSGGKLKPGQTVHSPLLPQEPVTSVPSAAVSNLPDGRRKVQVLRDNVVRNLTVRVLGPAGGEQVFVSGRFGPTDEVVVATTRELADGTPLKAFSGSSGAKAAKSSGDKKKKPATTNSGF